MNASGSAGRIPRMSHGRLVVHTKNAVLEVPLSGDLAFDSLLERLAARGGAVVRDTGALKPPAGRGDAWEPPA